MHPQLAAALANEKLQRVRQEGPGLRSPRARRPHLDKAREAMGWAIVRLGLRIAVRPAPVPALTR